MSGNASYSVQLPPSQPKILDTAPRYDWTGHPGKKETILTASTKVVSETAPAIPPDFQMLETLAVLCGLGLLASLGLVSSGLLFISTEPEALNIITWI
jgi:hypothetical protein